MHCLFIETNSDRHVNDESHSYILKLVIIYAYNIHFENVLENIKNAIQ